MFLSRGHVTVSNFFFRCSEAEQREVGAAVSIMLRVTLGYTESGQVEVSCKVGEIAGHYGEF